jgi:hypothetical protein
MTENCRLIRRSNEVLLVHCRNHFFPFPGIRLASQVLDPILNFRSRLIGDVPQPGRGEVQGRLRPAMQYQKTTTTARDKESRPHYIMPPLELPAEVTVAWCDAWTEICSTPT